MPNYPEIFALDPNERCCLKVNITEFKIMKYILT